MAGDFYTVSELQKPCQMEFACRIKGLGENIGKNLFADPRHKQKFICLSIKEQLNYSYNSSIGANNRDEQTSLHSSR